MDMETVLNLLLGYVPQAKVVLQGLGTLAVLGAVYVKLTPTESDDAWYAKMEAIPLVGSVLKALVAFSPISRK
jgi:hypothetical protein